MTNKSTHQPMLQCQAMLILYKYNANTHIQRGTHRLFIYRKQTFTVLLQSKVTLTSLCSPHAKQTPCLASESTSIRSCQPLIPWTRVKLQNPSLSSWVFSYFNIQGNTLSSFTLTCSITLGLFSLFDYKELISQVHIK